MATEEVDFYNPHSLLKREPGIYLDQLERIQAEEVRAVMEDRDPDYDENLAAGAGTPLVTRAELPRVQAGTAPEVYSTLSVDFEDEDSVQEGTEEHDNLRHEANKATLELITEARKERITAEAEASKKAAENHAKQEKTNLDAALSVATNPSKATAGEKSLDTDNHTENV